MIANNEELLAAGILMGVASLFAGNSLFYLFRWKDLIYFTLGIVLLGLGYLAFYAGIVRSGLIYSYPLLFGSDLVVTTIIVLAMYFHLTAILNSKFKWKIYYWIFSLYPVFLLFSLFIYYFKHSEEIPEIIRDKTSLLAISYYPGFHIFVMHILAIAAIGLYSLIAFIKDFKWMNVADKYRKGAGIAWIAHVFTVCFIVYITLRSTLAPELPTGLSTLEYCFYYIYFFLYYLFVQLWPYMYKYGPVYYDLKTFRIERSFAWQFEGISRQRIEENLDAAMQKDRVYNNEKLTLGELAEKAGITAHQLSLYLNQYLNMNYNDYVNSFRINEAKHLLQSEQGKKIIEVCYDVGFNNLSVFYEAFKKETGMPPKQWLKKTSGA